MTSPSTRFLGQPRERKPIFIANIANIAKIAKIAKIQERAISSGVLRRPPNQPDFS
jgi:hypothetical protein